MVRSRAARAADAASLLGAIALPVGLLAVVASLPPVDIRDSQVGWVIPLGGALVAATAAAAALVALVAGLRHGSVAALVGVGAAAAVAGAGLGLALTGELGPIATGLPAGALLGLGAVVAARQRPAVPGRGTRTALALAGLLVAEAAVVAGLLPSVTDAATGIRGPLLGASAGALAVAGLLAPRRRLAVTVATAAVGAAAIALDRDGSLELVIGLACLIGAGLVGTRAVIRSREAERPSLDEEVGALPPLAHHLTDAVLRFDGRLTLADWNASAATLLGLGDDASGTRLEDLLGVSLGELPIDDSPRVVQTAVGGIEVRLHRSGDGLVAVLDARREADGEERLSRELRGTIEELLEARRTIELQRAELERQSTVDPLTGVASRGAIIARLRTEIAQARRYQHPVALVLLDIDGFDAINRHHGVAGGDALLREVALRMRLRVREADALGRAGSDGFLAVLPHTTEGGAATFADALRQRLRDRPLPIGDELVTVTASIGVAVMRPGEELDLDAMLARVTEALDSARSAGGDRIALDRAHGLARLEDRRDAGDSPEQTDAV